MMQPTFSDTLGNLSWLATNEVAMKSCLPDQWTSINEFGQAGALKVAWQLKLLGVDWQHENEFGRIMVYLEKIKFLERNGLMIRRNPRSIFTKDAIALPSLN